MRSIKQIIRNPLCLGAMIIRKLFCRTLPEATYLRLLYFFEMGRPLRLNNPKLFTEKLQWLKLHNRKPEHTLMVDKLEAKKIAADLIGEKHVTKTYGVWENFDEIDFSKLPESFVLKSTNGSGGDVYICQDKKNLDKNQARQIVEGTKDISVAITFKEWPYKNIVPKIFAEELLSDGVNTAPKDYKFFCFHGDPKLLKVDYNRYEDHHANYYDSEWNLLPFGEAALPPQPSHIEQKPENFDEMLAIASKLSKGHPFLRIDLYNVNGKIYFGEMTFFPASGMGKFTSSKWDRQLGDYIHIEKNNGIS